MEIFSRPSSRRRAASLGAISLIAVLSACVSGPSEGPAPGGEEGTIDPAASVSWATERAISSVFDPVVPENDNIFVITPFFMVFDALLNVDAEGKIAAGLAEKWEIKETSIELTLRKGLLFQDGEPLNAEAVKANLDRLETMPALGAQVLEARDRIDSVSVVDENTVRIELPGGVGPVPYYLAVQTGMMASPSSIGPNGSLTDPVGAGPYTVKDFNPGSSVVLSRWEDYWDFSADSAAEWKMQYVADPQARVNLLRDRQVDVAIVAPRNVQELEAQGFEMLRTDKPSYTVIHMNHSVPGLNDVRVRQAMEYAIDREGWGKSINYGLADPIWQFFPEGHPLHLSEYDNYYPYDPEKARELLAEAGYADRLSLTLQVLNTGDERLKAETFQAMMADVGIEVTLNVIDPSQFFEFGRGKHDLMLGTVGTRPDPWQAVGNWVADGASYQPGGAASPHLAELLKEARQLVPGDEQNALIKDAIGEAVEQAAFIPIVTAPVFYATPKGCIVGFEPFLGAGADKWAKAGATDQCK